MDSPEKKSMAESMGTLIADLSIEQAFDILSASVAFRIGSELATIHDPRAVRLAANALMVVFADILQKDVSDCLDAMDHKSN